MATGGMDQQDVSAEEPSGFYRSVSRALGYDLDGDFIDTGDLLLYRIGPDSATYEVAEDWGQSRSGILSFLESVSTALGRRRKNKRQVENGDKWAGIIYDLSDRKIEEAEAEDVFVDFKAGDNRVEYVEGADAGAVLSAVHQVYMDEGVYRHPDFADGVKKFAEEIHQ